MKINKSSKNKSPGGMRPKLSLSLSRKQRSANTSEKGTKKSMGIAN